MIINILEIQLQTVFYPGFSNITSVQAPILGKKILLADKYDNHVLYHTASQFGNCCSMVWARRQGQWKGKNFSLSFSEEAAKKLCVVLQCIFGRGFLSPHTTIVSGIEYYPSASMSCVYQSKDKFLPLLSDSQTPSLNS